MQNHPDIKWVLDVIVSHYLDAFVSLIFALIIPACFYYVLVAFGKETALKSDRRKHFYVMTGIVVFAIFFVLILAAGHLDNQIEDIRNSSLQKGNLKGGVLGAIPLPKSTASTNSQMEGTLSGAGANEAKVGDGIDMLFVIRVNNSGSPTTVWDWKAYVELPEGGGTINAQIPSIAQFSSPATVLTAYGPYSLKMEDNILNALSSIPLQNGAGKEGWLVIHVNGLTEPQPGMKFIISFQDVYGRETRIEHIWIPGT